jgi:hypothetical protein
VITSLEARIHDLEAAAAQHSDVSHQSYQQAEAQITELTEKVLYTPMPFVWTHLRAPFS